MLAEHRDPRQTAQRFDFSHFCIGLDVVPKVALNDKIHRATYVRLCTD